MGMTEKARAVRLWVLAFLVCGGDALSVNRNLHPKLGSALSTVGAAGVVGGVQALIPFNPEDRAQEAGIAAGIGAVVGGGLGYLYSHPRRPPRQSKPMTTTTKELPTKWQVP